MNARPRPRRRLAVLAVLAAVGVAITAVIATTASAATTGTCTSAVNVRKEPSTTSQIVGVCERGHSTQVGEKRNGFVRLSEFGGWASAQYVSTGTERGSSAPNQTRGDESTNRARNDESSSNPRTSPRSDGSGFSIDPPRQQDNDRSAPSRSSDN